MGRHVCCRQSVLLLIVWQLLSTSEQAQFPSSQILLPLYCLLPFCTSTISLRLLNCQRILIAQVFPTITKQIKQRPRPANRLKQLQGLYQPSIHTRLSTTTTSRSTLEIIPKIRAITRGAVRQLPRKLKHLDIAKKASTTSRQAPF